MGGGGRWGGGGGGGGATEQGFQATVIWGSIPLGEKKIKKSELSIAHPEIILVKPEK